MRATIFMHLDPSHDGDEAVKVCEQHFNYLEFAARTWPDRILPEGYELVEAPIRSPYRHSINLKIASEGAIDLKALHRHFQERFGGLSSVYEPTRFGWVDREQPCQVSTGYVEIYEQAAAVAA